MTTVVETLCILIVLQCCIVHATSAHVIKHTAATIVGKYIISFDAFASNRNASRGKFPDENSEIFGREISGGGVVGNFRRARVGNFPSSLCENVLEEISQNFVRKRFRSAVVNA